MERRSFIKKSAVGGGLMLLGGFPFQSLANSKTTRLTILHTNDLHGNLTPFPEGTKFAGLGGAAARLYTIEKVRAENEHVLLLDAGDFLHGNISLATYKGKPELEAMNKMGYDAVALGSHDFDAGREVLGTLLSSANFPVVNSCSNFENTPLEGKSKRYVIAEKGGLKIGIFGVGILPDGLVKKKSYEVAEFSNPLHTAVAISETLKNVEKCDFVICLSRLGLDDNENGICDRTLASMGEHIDLVVGGGTHIFLEKPLVVQNKRGNKTVINHAGWGGVRLGKLDYEIDSKKGTKLLYAQSVILGKETIAV